MNKVSVLLVLGIVACGGGDGGSPESSDLRRICAASATCRTTADEDVERCVDELDASLDDTSRAHVTTCAECMDTKSCSEIEDFACDDACGPLHSVNRVDGTVEGSCSDVSTGNYAFRSSSGTLVVRVTCSGGQKISSGEFFDVGDEAPCESFGLSCKPASGTMSIVEREGRRWVTGACECKSRAYDFDVPFHIEI